MIGFLPAWILNPSGVARVPTFTNPSRSPTFTAEQRALTDFIENQSNQHLQ
jgi:hypothetical protein